VHIKKYPCTEKKCAERVPPIAFGTKRDLERHRKTHNKGAARIKCPYCEAEVGRPDNLPRHIAAFHGDQLFTAAAKGDIDTVATLLEGGADVESRDRDGETSLCLAAAKGHESIVRLLLDRGANVNSRGEKSGQTPLFKALKNRHRSITALLLEKGADPVLPNHLQQGAHTPLEWAFKHRHETSAKLLLNHGAGTKLKYWVLDCFTTVATQRQWESVIPLLLLEREASTRGWGYLRGWRYLRGLDDAAGISARLGNMTILKSLSEHADKMKLGFNLVAILAKAKCQLEGVILFALEQHRHKINALDVYDKYVPQSALHFACKTGNDVLVRLLLEYGAQIDIETRYSKVTPLWNAVYYGHGTAAEMLLIAGANPMTMAPSHYGRRSVLGYAIKKKNEGMIQLLNKYLQPIGTSSGTQIPT